MVELQQLPDGLLRRGWGGDTLNTAVYLARLGASVDYVTALGDDRWSTEMLVGWAAEGVGTSLVQRLPGRLPGLYVIQTDPNGERRFLYWRDNSAARRLFDHLDPRTLAAFDVFYLSGITLSILDGAGQAVLFQVLAEARARGAKIVFDTNFRPRGWSDPALARRLYDRLFGLAHLVLASSEDLCLLYGNNGEAALLAHAGDTEIVLKLDHPASRIFHAGTEHAVHALPVACVMDTTAAGDSFAAAYLAARLRGAAPGDAAQAGHALAGAVVQHSGAIIPRDAMPQRTLP